MGQYQADGPFGKGCQIDSQRDGTYIAFAAGTGVLVFIDFVAYIARNVLG